MVANGPPLILQMRSTSRPGGSQFQFNQDTRAATITNANDHVAVSNSKDVVFYTLMHNRGTRSSAQSSAHSHSSLCTHLVAGLGVGLPLADDHSLEVLALSHLGLDLLDVFGEVGVVLHSISASQ